MSDQSELDRLKNEVVFGFYEEAYPLFVQGYAKGVHELSSPVTAEECAGYVRRIQDLKAALIDVLAALELFVDIKSEHRKPYDHPLSAWDRGYTVLNRKG